MYKQRFVKKLVMVNKLLKNNFIKKINIKYIKNSSKNYTAAAFLIRRIFFLHKTLFRLSIQIQNGFDSNN